MSESLAKPSDTSERRSPFGLWSAVFLVVANMLGAGVFTTSGFSLSDLGSRSAVMWAWLLGGLIAICGAISYGQLAKRITESGGEYLFLSRMVHPAVGFLAGWVSLLAGFTGAIAFAATAFEAYAFPVATRSENFVSGAVAIFAIVVFGFLHSLVAKFGIAAQNLIVAIKLVSLLGFIAFAFYVTPAQWPGMQITMEAKSVSIFTFASTLVWISLAYSGFNAAVYVTSEVDRPKMNVPRALLIGTLLVTVFYLVLNFIFVYSADPAAISGVAEVADVSAKAVSGNELAFTVRMVICVALLSSVSSMVIAGPRVYDKMAKDGLFPQVLRAKTVQEGNSTPAIAIWFQVGLASLMVYFSNLRSLMDYLGFTLSVSAALSVACLFWTRSRFQNRNESQPEQVGMGFRAIALTYVTATIVLAVVSAINRPLQLIGFGATVGLGLVCYAVLGWFRRRTNESLSD